MGELLPVKVRRARFIQKNIDWGTLEKMWMAQTRYTTVQSYLISFGLDPTKRRFKEITKYWEGKEFASAEAKKLLDRTLKNKAIPEDYEEKVSQVMSMIRTWRALQAEKDYELGNELRDLVMYQISKLKEKCAEGKEIRTFDILNLTKILETVQRVQRLSLGMSTDNVGIEDARDLAEQQTGIDPKDTTPIFEVEVNNHGKFTRMRPRRVN
jgi:hypothetical protein